MPLKKIEIFFKFSVLKLPQDIPFSVLERCSYIGNTIDLKKLENTFRKLKNDSNT